MPFIQSQRRMAGSTSEGRFYNISPLFYWRILAKNKQPEGIKQKWKVSSQPFTGA